MEWSKKPGPSGHPSYRWVLEPQDLQNPETPYRTIEMFNDVLMDVRQDGQIIGIEAYMHDLRVDDLVRILADPNIRYIFPKEG